MAKTSIPAMNPRGSEFAGANKTPGDVFGDSSSRPNPSAGSSLADGLAERFSIADVTYDSLGGARNEATGKPAGPQKGPVNNPNGSAKLQWG